PELEGDSEDALPGFAGAWSFPSLRGAGFDRGFRGLALVWAGLAAGGSEGLWLTPSFSDAIEGTGAFGSAAVGDGLESFDSAEAPGAEPGRSIEAISASFRPR